MTDLSRIDSRSEALILRLVHEGIFTISPNGRIWREKVKRGRIVKPCKPRRPAEYESSNGYLRIRVSVNGVCVRASAHRVVYRYFKGDIPDDCVINHVDKKRWNNHPENLEAVTQSQNVKHARGQPYLSCG